MASEEKTLEKIVFKDYYGSLDDTGKRAIRYSLCPEYMAESSFFLKLRTDTFTKLEREKIDTLCKTEFVW